MIVLGLCVGGCDRRLALRLAPAGEVQGRIELGAQSLALLDVQFAFLLRPQMPGCLGPCTAVPANMKNDENRRRQAKRRQNDDSTREMDEETNQISRIVFAVTP